ncbi:hypothetical protein E2320_022085, partial [Naja naja]
NTEKDRHTYTRIKEGPSVRTLWPSSHLPDFYSEAVTGTSVFVSPDHSKRLDCRNRVPVRYCNLGSRDSVRNPHTLVEVTSFAALNKFQPFNVAISSNVLLLVVVLTVLRAFPCRSRLGDGELAAIVEEEICQNLFLRGLSLVGWYHSHPFSHPLPSLQDIDMQMDYQLKLQGTSNSFQPCLALICAMNLSLPQRPYDYGIPIEVEVTYIQDGFLTNDILHEMGSLASRIPKDQGFGHILEQVYAALQHSS